MIFRDLPLDIQALFDSPPAPDHSLGVVWIDVTKLHPSRPEWMHELRKAYRPYDAYVDADLSKFPPVLVSLVNGKWMLHDGLHRLWAALRQGKIDFPAVDVTGMIDDPGMMPVELVTVTS